MIRAFRLFVLVTAALLLVACQTKPTTVEGRSDLRVDADRALANARAADPTLDSFISNSKGYAVFPSVGKGGLIVGGAYGRGMLYENGRPISYCDITQGTVGGQIGGQSYTEIIFFETYDSLGKFKSGNFAFAAQATAVAVKSGAGANAGYADGIAVFTMGEKGLMAEAVVGGQKFHVTPIQNESVVSRRH
jgi:lipid-binding SYLF domain-containing protein